VPKGDTLGLGAQSPFNLADEQSTGLDAFQDLLGRLSGKSGTEPEKEQQQPDDRKLATSVESRWKTMRFVRGGLLLHEKIETLAEVKSNGTYGRNDGLHGEEIQKSEKRRKEGTSRRDAQMTCKPLKSNKQYSAGDSGGVEPGEDLAFKKSRKKSKMKNRKAREVENSEAEKTRKVTNMTIAIPRKITEKNAYKGRVREQRPTGRHIIRGRHIQQKKLALVDTKSLNEVTFIHSFLTPITLLIMFGTNLVRYL
jgi:Pin2-interacting protein X1